MVSFLPADSFYYPPLYVGDNFKKKWHVCTSSCGCGCPRRRLACTQHRSPCNPAIRDAGQGSAGLRCAPGPSSTPPPPPGALRTAPGTFCRMRFRQTLSSQSMSGSPRPGSFLESRRYTSTSTSGSASASCEAQVRGESRHRPPTPHPPPRGHPLLTGPSHAGRGLQSPSWVLWLHDAGGSSRS